MVIINDKKYEVQTDSSGSKTVKTDDEVYEVKTGADGREYIEAENNKYYLETEVKIQTKNSVNYMRAEVKKQWDNSQDSNNQYSTRPDAVAYEFQYRPTGTQEWKTVENDWIFNVQENGNTVNVGDGIYKTIDGKEIYIIAESKDDEKVNYDVTIQELPSSDSSDRPVEYRFVESYLCYDKQENGTYSTYVKMPSENALYTKTESTQKSNLTAVNPTDPKYKYTTTVTNTLNTTSLTVIKKWGEDVYRISDHIVSTEFIIERRVKTGEETYSDWEKTADYSDKNHSVYSGDIQTTIPKSEIAGNINGQSDSIVWQKLPKYDLQNREYEYRAVEKSITTSSNPNSTVGVIYGNGGEDETYGSVGGFNYESQHETVRNQETNKAESYRSELTNTPVVSKLAVTKEWDDENNRDGIRQDIKITLSATIDDGTTAKINLEQNVIDFNNKHTNGVADNRYYYIWYNLPLTDAEGNPITYTLTEPQTEAYTSKVSITSYNTEKGRYESTEFAEVTAQEINGKSYYSGSVKLGSLEETAFYVGESEMNGEALVYDESVPTDEAKQISKIIKVEFKNIHTPRYMSIGTNKVWKSDDGVENTSRPPQGVLYTLKYREKGNTQWQEVPWEEWSELYDVTIDGEEYDVTIDNSQQNIGSAEGWNTRWNNLPVNKKGSEGVKFEYCITESGKPYADGKDGLYNYDTAYGNQNEDNPQAVSGNSVTESEESVNNVTETITNTLRTFILTKEIDPGYIGETQPELYSKKFKFSILITDDKNKPIETLKMQPSSDGIITQAYNSDTEHQGLAKMELSHGESVVIYNIPDKMYYTIVEDDYYTEGFKAYITVNGEDETASSTITGTNSAMQEITYINRVLPLPAAGGEGIGAIITLSLILLLTSFTAGGIYCTVSYKRQNSGFEEYPDTAE